MLLALTMFACTEQLTEDNRVVITFITGDETINVEPVEGIPGKNIPSVDIPEREGYTFIGWETSEGMSYRLTRFPDESLTLYAKWDDSSGVQGEYTIQFLTNTSEYIDPIVLTAGDTIPNLPIPMYYETDGMVSTFDGWFYQDDRFNLKTMPSYDIVLSASWETGQYAIYFNTLSNDVVQPIVANPGEDIEAPAIVPIKEEAIFQGWSFNDKPYIFDRMPNESITVEATWLLTDENASIYNEQTSLPKMFINLDNNQSLQSVTKEDYVDSSITISSQFGENDLYASSAEFKGRGNGSWWSSGPKRGYRIKFFEKQSLFGEYESKHWVLLAGANFYDPTLMKTQLAFGVTNEVFSNIEYASSTHWVELYVNGEYRGVYVLAEHVRVANERVDIDEDFGVIDTGYLIEYDVYASGEEGIDYFNVDGYRYGFTVKSPDPEDYLEEGITKATYESQITYLSEYVSTALEAALAAPQSQTAYETFEQYADVDSFVDMYILHELFKNTDTGWSSFFMYKKAGGKLYAGPPWDFDASAGKNRGDQSYSGIYVAGSVVNESGHTSSELYLALLQVDAFQARVKTRWQEISAQLNTYFLNELSDIFIDIHQEALAKNYYFWSENYNIEGMNAESSSRYTRYSSIEDAQEGWSNQMVILRQWFIYRIDWLNTEWQ